MEKRKNGSFWFIAAEAERTAAMFLYARSVTNVFTPSLCQGVQSGIKTIHVWMV